MTDTARAVARGGTASRQLITPNRLGVALFITSEAVFFASLVLMYIVYHGRQAGGPDARSSLDVFTTGIFSICLWASSFTVAMAGSRAHRGDLGGFRIWLAATIALGAIFLVGQGMEYWKLYHEDVTISRNLFGSTFFTLTGFHGLHVFIGLLALLTMFGLGWFVRDFVPRRYDAFESVSLYWHFVDGVWVVVFAVVYLWTLIQ